MLWVNNPGHGWAPFLVYTLASAFIIAVVGGIAEVEREVRGRYIDLMGGIDAVVWEQLTHSPTTLYVNRRAEEIIGYPADNWAQPHFWAEHVHPDDVEWVAERYQTAVKAGENCEVEYRFIRPDGSVVWLQDRMRVEVDANGAVGQRPRRHGRRHRPQAGRGAHRPVREPGRATSTSRCSSSGSTTGGSPSTTPPASSLLAVNPEGAHLIEPPADDAIGRRLSEILTPANETAGQLITEALGDVIRSGEGFRFEDLRFEGDKLGGSIFSANVFPLPGGSVGVSLQDVTEQVTAAEVLRRQALHDGLTGLPNRSNLTDRLRRSLRRSSHTLDPVALLVMDLDQFKEINDALGHDHGDRLLIELSHRLEELLEGSERRRPSRRRRVRRAVDRAGRPAGRPRRWPPGSGPRSNNPSTSAGSACRSTAASASPCTPSTPSTPRRWPAGPTWRCTRPSAPVVAWPSTRPSTTSRASVACRLLGELRRAINEDELVLHFQPSIDLATGERPRRRGPRALGRTRSTGCCRRASSSSWPRCRA